MLFSLSLVLAPVSPSWFAGVCLLLLPSHLFRAPLLPLPCFQLASALALCPDLQCVPPFAQGVGLLRLLRFLVIWSFLACCFAFVCCSMFFRTFTNPLPGPWSSCVVLSLFASDTFFPLPFLHA